MLTSTENTVADTNPYLVSSVASPEHLSDDIVAWGYRLPLLVWLVAFFYPVLVALGIYASWIVAWVCLGHMPRPSLDDPGRIGGVMDWVYPASILALVSVPVLAPLCFFSSFLCPLRLSKNPSLQWLFLGSIYLSLCGVIIAIMRSDPGRVIEWWFD